MKKIAIFLFPTVVYLVSLIVSALRLQNNLQIYNTLNSSIVAFFAVPGALYCYVLMKKWGGLKSVMGKGFLFLALSFLSQGLSYLINYLFFRGSFYPPIVTLILGLMNVFWAVAAYHFLILTGITQKARLDWKIFIVGSLVIGSVMAVYGNVFTSALFATEVFNSTIIFVDLVMIIETFSLLIKVKNFNGGFLFLPILFFSFGIIFQLIGDLVMNNVLRTDLDAHTLDSMFYSLSWYLLSLSPASLLLYQISQETKETISKEPTAPAVVETVALYGPKKTIHHLYKDATHINKIKSRKLKK